MKTMLDARRVAALPIAFALIAAAGAVGCIANPDDGEEDVAALDEDVSACAKTISFGGLTFRTPTSWTKWASGNNAYIGLPLQQTNLHVIKGYTGSIDSLQGTSCELDGPDANSQVISVDVLQSGNLPVGKLTAEHRKWKYHCSTGSTEIHHAWLLPGSKIAIYEQFPGPANLKVVTTAGTGGGASPAAAICGEATKNITFGALTFRTPSSWGIDRNGSSAVVGILAGGPSDVNLHVLKGFKGNVDDLAPTGCYVEGEPGQAPLNQIDVIESGTLPIGKRMAQYRRWDLTCQGGITQKNRAWVLPGLDMAVFEQHQALNNVPVVTYAIAK